jgi:hypothetical protein
MLLCSMRFQDLRVWVFEGLSFEDFAVFLVLKNTEHGVFMSLGFD